MPKYYLTPIVPEQIHVFLTHTNIHRIHASDTSRARRIRAAFPLTVQRGPIVDDYSRKLERWDITL